METTGANIAVVARGRRYSAVCAGRRGARRGEKWDELNDRFYKTLAFGTGGLRGRTIGKVVTASERGAAKDDAPPEFPCVGTNAMNFYNIARATRGLVGYLHDWFASERIGGRPKLVIAHDTRHFSREFTALAAEVAAENGCDAYIFDGPRSTPELSFAVRHLKRERRDRDYGEPQPAARQRLQGLLQRRRASDRAARERDHREGKWRPRGRGAKAVRAVDRCRAGDRRDHDDRPRNR